MSSAARNASIDTDYEPIAIIGMACIFPGAGNLQQYWSNIKNGVSAISDVPESRWAPEFYDPDSTAADRFYCRKGGFVDEFVDFDPLAYGIMPKAAASADPDQLLSLRVGVEALQDAGLWQKDFNREKTGVIIGRGNYLSAGTLRLEQHVRLVQQTLQTLQDLIPGISSAELDAVKDQIRSKLTHYGPDTAVGLIPNLVASRLANRLDLKGPAYTVDGACASALLAIEQSCQSLRRGDCDVMLTGGLHFTHDLTFWSTFCQLGALSRSGTISPMSANADGILAGEGIGLFVLKRLSDAVSANDRIYSVIRGVASASDGKSSGLLAPAVEGQLLALQRAWRQSGLDKNDIGLVEAHGTGTPAGDNAELKTLAQFFGTQHNNQARAGLGSVKSMIGHTMPAAGAAGLIKAALSVYHGVKPITLQSQQPNPLVEKTRFQLLSETRQWSQPVTQRIAAVNAFGFGGINAHVVVSGYERSADALTTAKSFDLPVVVRLSANSQQALLDKLANQQWLVESDSRSASRSAEGRSGGNEEGNEEDNEEGGAAEHHQQDEWRLAIIDPTEARLTLARTVVEKGRSWQGRSQIYFSRDPILARGKIAFLFPGVDSVFDPKVDDVAEYFGLALPDYCEKLDPAKDLLKIGLGLTGVNKLLNQVLARLNIDADAMAGHSVGEWSALAASGVLSQALIDEVNSKMDPESLEVPEVVFLAVANGLSVLSGLYEDLNDVYISHDNCPHQVIFCGREEGIEELHGRLKTANILAQKLPIVSGFHSPLLADYAQPFTDFFSGVTLSPGHTPLWSANSAEQFPVDEAGKKALVIKHLVEKIRFREMLENMYQQGFRGFIQVGCGSLTGFVNDTLKGKPHFTIAANVAKHSGLEQLCHVLAGLWVEGATPDFCRLGLAQSGLTPSASATPGCDDTLHEKRAASSVIRLQLGVPLLKLDIPLALEKKAGADLHNSDYGDPLQSLFQQTLSEIEQASSDIKTLWSTRHLSTQPLANANRFTAVKKVLTQRLDINDNIAFVKDHSFYPQAPGWPVIADRHPVIPLTMEVSLMRKAVEQVVPGLKVIGFENLKAFSWLIVEEPVDIEIEVDYAQRNYAEVSIKGYAQATAILADDYPPSPDRIVAEYKNPRATAVSAKQLYCENWMFHGPAYQSIIALGPIADNGIQGTLKVSEGEGALLDNMGQLAGYWVMEEEVDCLAMPIGVEKINFYGPDPIVGQELHCDVYIRSQDRQSCITDQQLMDSSGRVIVRMDGWTTRRYAMDRRFWIHSKQVEKYLLCESSSKGYVVFEDRYETAITRDYMARRYLNQPETNHYRTISPRRKRQWLNGRIAAKDAVRAHLWERQGHFDFFPKELRVDNNGRGAPFVVAHISDTYQNNLNISIAHKDNVAVAIAAEGPVGIDVEHIEPRDDNFIDLVMGMEEIAVLHAGTALALEDEMLACVWAAKEAVAKKMGTGLEGKPKAYVLEEIDGDRLKVSGHWVMSTKHNSYMICWTE